MRIPRLQPSVEFCHHEAKLVNLVTAVQPLTTRASFRHDLAVAVLPAAKRLGGHAQHPGDGPDAVHTVAPHAGHPHTIPQRTANEERLQIVLQLTVTNE